MTINEWKKKYMPEDVSAPQGTENKSPTETTSNDFLDKWRKKYMPESVNKTVSSFDDLEDYFSKSTKVVSEAGDYYNSGTSGQRRAAELEKIKEKALTLDDFTATGKSSTSVMAVSGYMTRENSPRSKYLNKQGFSSMKELDEELKKAQTSDSYDRSFGTKYETELTDAYNGGKSALKFIEENKESFEDYDQLHSQLNDYLESIKVLTDAMKGVRDYYSQWENADEYKKGYGFLKTVGKTIESGIESIKGGYTAASATMSGSKQNDLSLGQSAQAAAQGKTTEEALEEVNRRRRQRAEQKMAKAEKYFDAASTAQMLATWQKSALGKTLVEAGTQVPALAGDIALSSVGSLVGVPQAGLVSMGVRAYGQGAADARRRGLSWEKAELAGIKSAAVEVTTEKLLGGATKLAYGKGWVDNTLDAGIEKALKRLGASKTLTKGIGYIVDAGEEGLEEMISDVINPIADRLLSLKDNDGEYLDEFDVEEMFHDGFVGFLLGLTGTSVNVAANAVVSTKQNKFFENATTEYIQELLDKSAKVNADSKLAEKIKKKVEKGEKITGKEVKELYSDYTEAGKRSDIKKIEQAAKKQLEKYGEKASVQELAEAIAKKIAGENLSSTEEKLIKTSVYGQRVVNELDPSNISSGEYSSEWVRSIGTEIINADEYNIEQTQEQQEQPLPLMDEAVPEQTAVESGEPLAPMNLDEQKQFIRDRYSGQVEKGLLSEESIDSMISELDDGIPLDSVIRRADNYVKETENNERNNAADGSMGRESGTGAGEQGGAVSEGAGRSEGSERAADGRAKEIRRDPQKKNTRRVSSKSLGLSNGTDTARLSVVEHSELGETANNIAILLGAKNVTVVKGAIEVSDENGKIRNVCGVKTADGKIIVRADHPLYSLEQLMLHETSHAYENTDMLEEMRAAAIEAIGKEALNELCIQYAVKWGGLYTEEDMHGVAAKKECEVYADALAGISRANTRGTKKLTSAIRKVFYKNTGIDVDLLMSYNTPKAAEAKQGKAQTAAAEPKAQAPPKEQNNPHNLNYSLDDYSVDELDSEYYEAIHNGDTQRVQALVDEAAIRAMPNSRIVDEDGKLLKVYHGSDAQFDVFDRSKGRSKMDINGSFFSPWELDAQGYGSNVRAFYLNISNPAPEQVGFRALNRFKSQNQAGIKAREYLERMGYDGVNNSDEEFIAFSPEQIKSADPITYDENGKVIPLSERFNLQNEDIRYSVDDAIATEEEAQYRRDYQKVLTGESLKKLRERRIRLEGTIDGYRKNDKLTEAQTKEVERLEANLDAVNAEIEKKTNKAEARRTTNKNAAEAAEAATDSLSVRLTTAQSRRALKGQLYEQYGIATVRRDVGAAIDAFADKWISQGRISSRDIASFEDALMQLGAIRVESENDYAREIRSWMANGQISVPQYVVEEFGNDWNSFRKRAFGNRIYLSIDSNHRGIDQWTQELANSFGEGVFDESADLKTQLEKIVDIAEDGRAENLTVYQMAEHIRKTQGRDSADEYLEDMHNQLIRNLKSFSQSAKIEMDIVKRNTYRRVRDDYIRREKAELAANERAQREFQKKVLKQLQWLKRNQNFMGSDFQKEARRILADIDTIAISAANEMNWSEKYQATWKDLGRMYKWVQEHDPNFLPNKEIENMISRVEGTHLDELSAYDLENIYKAAVALRTAFYNRNNVIGDELHRSFAEMYDDARAELKAADKPKDTTSRTQKYWDSQLNPIHRIERMFGWNENSAGFQIFGRGLERGERATKRYVEQSNQLLDVWLEEHKDWVSKSDGQGKDAVWYELEVPELLQFKMGDKPIFGKSVKVYMTPMQKIYMYLESKNYDNLRHMVGGRTFADKSLYAEGKREEAFANGTTISLAPETVKKIVSDLTAEELELAEILDKQYFNGYAKTEINRVSNILYGYDRAMNEKYAPIFTNSNYNKTEPGMLQDGTAEGVGHMKTRAQGAKNPTYNVSALEAFRKHVSQTSRFVGMAIPAQNAKTLLNWSGNGTTMQEAITHSWSKKELDELKSIMTELQAPTYLEQSEFSSIFGRLMSNYIGGIFGSNITVAAKVLASKPTAAIVLGNRYYPTIAQQKTTDAKLISKYTSELDVRARGYGTPELAAMTLSQSKYMQWVQSHKGTKLFLGGGLLQAADIYVTKMMWPWAENKVRAEYPELEIGTQEEIDSGNSPFYKKVAEIYENAIGDTQSMYDIMHRSDIMRDTNEITRSFTIFHTDSLQAMNLIRKRAGELSAAKKNAEKAQTDETKAAANAKVKTAAKELSSCIGNVILMNAVVTLFDILRDLFRRREDKYANDEGEITFWSFIGNSLTQLMDNASGMLIGVDALTSAILTTITGDTYYDHEIIAVKTFNDLIKLGQDTEKGLRGFITKLVDVIQNDGDVWEYIVNDGDARGTIKTAAEKIAHFFGGLPIENVEKLLVNTIGLFFPQVSAAYSGFWQTSSKKELSDSKSLETDIANLYSNKLDLSDEIAEELARLYEAGYKNAVITDTPETVTIEGEEIELNEALRQKYNNAAGKALEYLEEVLGSDEYQAASDEDKAKMLNRLNGYAGDVAKAAVTGAKLEGFAANVPGWLDEGMGWGQIVSGNTNENKIAARYYEAGVEPRVVNEVIETLEAIEPEEGKKPTTSQKVRAIGYMTLSESNKEAALSVALSEKAYTRYMIARNNGVSSADYADFLEILDHIDVNGGDPSRDDFKTAVERANFNRNSAREIWATYWKSSSPW